MTVCPIAVVAGCKNCPAVSICLLKGVLGDYQKEDNDAESKPAKSKSDNPEK